MRFLWNLLLLIIALAVGYFVYLNLTGQAMWDKKVTHTVSEAQIDQQMKFVIVTSTRFVTSTYSMKSLQFDCMSGINVKEFKLDDLVWTYRIQARDEMVVDMNNKYMFGRDTTAKTFYLIEKNLAPVEDERIFEIPEDQDVFEPECFAEYVNSKDRMQLAQDGRELLEAKMDADKQSYPQLIIESAGFKMFLELLADAGYERVLPPANLLNDAGN